MTGMTGVSLFEANDYYIGHNYSAPEMTEQELAEMRGGTTKQIVYVFTSTDNEKSLAQTVAERGSKSERDFSGRPLEGY